MILCQDLVSCQVSQLFACESPQMSEDRGRPNDSNAEKWLHSNCGKLDVVTYIPNFANGFLFRRKVPFDIILIKNEG